MNVRLKVKAIEVFSLKEKETRIRQLSRPFLGCKKNIPPWFLPSSSLCSLVLTSFITPIFVFYLLVNSV